MTELELYKFINDNSIEWSKEINDHTEDILIFPYTFQMDRFVELVKDCDFDVSFSLISPRD